MDLKNEFQNNYPIKETLLDDLKSDNENKKKNIDEVNIERKNATNKNEKPCLSEKLNEAVVFIHKPLCADYHSESDSEIDNCLSDSENSASTSSNFSDIEETIDTLNIEKEKRLCRKQDSTDIPFNKLPPIEDLKISVPEQDCMEIGIITNIVDVLVVVEAFKGTPALDVDTVLFLDFGNRTLGKIFEVLGPITEPVYAVRFNSNLQILNNMIKKGLIVYYAPKSLHTTFVFLSEVMKIRGSDASWKDNVEAPLEFQDFSDDETEKHFKCKSVKQGQSTNSHKRLNSRKYSFNFIRQQNNHKMRYNNFCNVKNLNGCFKSHISTSGSPKKIKWTNEINPVALISGHNFENPYSSIYTQRCNTSNIVSSSSQVYFSPRLSTPFPFAKTMPSVRHMQCFQEQNQSSSQNLKMQWPQCSPLLPLLSSLQNDDQQILYK